MREIQARRYRCRRCGAVLVVVPRGLLPRRHFSAGAIALALLRFGIGVRVVDIRAAVGGQGQTAAWIALRRWVAAAGVGRLWRSVRASPTGWSARAIAERAAMTVAAFAPAGRAYATTEERVVAGAAHAV